MSLHHVLGFVLVELLEIIQLFKGLMKREVPTQCHSYQKAQLKSSLNCHLSSAEGWVGVRSVQGGDNIRTCLEICSKHGE